MRTSLPYLAYLLACAGLLLLLPDLALAGEPFPGAYTAPAFANNAIRSVFCDLLSLIEGEFGGMVTAAAGVFAIGYVAFGDIRKGSSLIVVAGGFFAISAGVSLYFGTFDCAAIQSGQTSATTTTREYSSTETTNYIFPGASGPRYAIGSGSSGSLSEDTPSSSKDPFSEL